MELRPLTQCKTSWPQVQAPSTWPVALIGLAINNELLFKGESDQALNLQGPNQSPQLVKDLLKAWPAPGLASLARLSQLTSFSDSIDLKLWWNSQAIPFDEVSSMSLEQLAQAPSQFQKWVDDKALSYREYSVLALLDDHELKQRLQTVVAELQLSRQNGARALEWASECLGMGQDPELVFADQVQWLEALKKLRYPLATDCEKTQRQKLSQVHIPKDFQIQPQRRGDLSGIHLAFFASSEMDLGKKLDRLSRLQPELVAVAFERA